MRKAWISCIGLVTCLGAVHASAEETHAYPACTKQANEADVAGAKGAFQAGNGSFNEADYARAITYWEDAYRRDCSAHALLLNLSRAYELNGQRAQAVIALKSYLERVPRTPERASYERRIEVLERQIASEQPKNTEADLDDSRLQPPPPAPPANSEEKPEAVAPIKPEPADRTTHRPAWPLIVGAGGLVIAGVGIPVFINARNDVTRFEKDCGTKHDRCTDQNDIDRGNEARNRSALGTGLIIGGGVLAGAGLITYLIWPVKSEQAVAQTWQPLLGPGLVGLGYSSKF